MPHLVLLQKDAQPVIFTITKDTTILGRSSANDVFLTDQSVSREHAKIVALEDGGYEIHDLGAKHPTSVNGMIISHHKLRNGDRIRLGDSVLIFRTGESCTTTHVEFLTPETP
ncbi:FHA domain-containing protein, partial [bacterium]|nr:FHA domain-containing protein [bacterium]